MRSSVVSSYIFFMLMEPTCWMYTGRPYTEHHLRLFMT